MADKPQADANAAPARNAAEVARPRDAVAPSRVVIVTGMSGAGKTLALKALEDFGFEAVDNLPLSLLSSLVPPGEGPARCLAIGIDIRTRGFSIDALLAAIDRLAAEEHTEVRAIFLDCDDDVLTRRYTETRRRHPLALDRPLLNGIHHERGLLSALRGRPYVTVIDTSHLPPAEFKRILALKLGLDAESGPVVFVTSFAYRNGLPREADLVFDARFLANPHYVEALRPLTGRSEEVARHVAADPDFDAFFNSMTNLLAPLLPRFAAEGKSYLTIAIGCTGGRHRSVFVAERLAAWLRDSGARVELRHRELEEGGR